MLIRYLNGSNILVYRINLKFLQAKFSIMFKEFWVQKNFESKKFWGPTKFWVQQYLVSNKIFVPTKISGSTKLWVPTNIRSEKIDGSKQNFARGVRLKTAKEPTKVKGVITKRIKQAGAELCQAQGKLILVWPLLDHCLLWLTNMVWICQFGLWIWQDLSLKSKVFRFERLYPSSLVEVSK